MFFCSDFHFNHKKMLEIRTQFNSLEEMNETMIENFNSKVKEKETSFIIGDFSWGNPSEFFDRLNGKFIFIMGNHDKKQISHKKVLKVVHGFYDTKNEGQKFTVCHYPMISWNCSHWGSWLFHGHHHSKTSFPGKIINVSVDALDFFPISWEEAKTIMENKEDNWDLIRR